MTDEEFDIKYLYYKKMIDYSRS